jgi:hypothetical protein
MIHFEKLGLSSGIRGNIPLLAELAEEGWPRYQQKWREASLLERTGWSDRRKRYIPPN